MKLKEIIEKLDKSDKNSCYLDIQEFASNNFDINSWFAKEPDRLKGYFFLNWQCTDTWVGYRAYFLDDKLIATSWQSCRKGGEEFFWVSKEAYSETKQYIISLMDETADKNIILVNLDEEYDNGFQIEYGSQLLTDKLILKSTGENVSVIGKFHKMDDIKNWGKVEVQFEDGRKKVVEMSEVLVPYNLKK